MFVPVDPIPCDCTVVFEEDSPAGPRFSVLTPVAASDDERRLVAVLTSLYPYEEDGYPMHEFQFAISVTDFETDEVFETCERDMARGYLPTDVAPRVMDCVLAAIPALVEHVQPVAIYRVTKATRPPDKALVKHKLVTSRFQECGFEITQSGTERAAREFWVMER